MAELQYLGAKFEDADAQGYHSSLSGSSSSPFVQASGASSNTSLSLSPNVSHLPPTHDTTKSHHHMKHLESFVGDLQLAAKRAFPNSAYSRYKEVQVLLMRWEEDELEVEAEMEELRKVFMNTYGFSTTQFLIPTQNSHRKLMHKSLSFVEEHDKEDMLLIVYYAGHGVINKARQSTWSCKSDRSYAIVEWSAIQTLFETARCDVLSLLDCCAGASATPITERPTNIKETIAACGFETWTPKPGPQSFTNTLIEVLKEWASQLPFSAAMLHSEILTRLKHAPPHWSSRGNTLVEQRKTPAYIVSPPDPHTASITLGRLVDEESCSSVSSRAIPGSILENLSERVQGDSHVSSEERLEALLAMDDKGQRKAPHVLLTVALEEDQILDAASCARWLKQFPLLAKFVSVEGVYRSYSTLLLLSVPVVLWDLVPDHPATQFVGYVRSRNLAPKGDSPKEATTPIPITGQSARGKKSYGFEYASPLKSVSGLSSLDSGYDSSSVPRTAAMVPARLARKTTDVSGYQRSILSKQVSTRKKQSPEETIVADLLVPRSLPTSAQTSVVLPGQGLSALKERVKQLVVTVGEADMDDDTSSGLTCVLCYGHEVQRSESMRSQTPKPIWNEEFRFDIRNSPMFYHLRVSVWEAHMGGLMGDLHIDLRSLFKKGQLPELGEWQNLRSDGKTTGVIRIALAYVDADEDRQRQAEVTKPMARWKQQQRQQQRQRRDESQPRVEEMDFPVW